jgi:hypothetical protein
VAGPKAGLGHVTIDILPDDILLLVFHFYRVTYIDGLAVVDRERRLPWRWDQLVHVCQRWRSIVFASPKSLDLVLVCGPSTPLELIDIWPPFPIIIRDREDMPIPKDYDFQAAIAHPNRVRQIDIRQITSSQLQRLASVMQEQFPALIHLRLESIDYFPQALPDGFLGGSAPRLQSLELDYTPFPALPKLLLSTNDLVCLSLRNIFYSGYVTSDAIVTSLAVLANLKSLTIGFDIFQSHPNKESRRLPRPTRTVLPALTLFEFRGASEYLDDLVARIDAPLLDSFSITFFNQFIFDISQLAQFMRRTTRIQVPNEAHVDFDYYDVQVEFRPPTLNLVEKPGLKITCRAINWPELSNVVHVLTSLFPSLYIVEHLYMYGSRSSFPQWQDLLQWLEILRPFTTVKNFYAVKEFVQHFAIALQGLVGERVTDVLPALESLHLEDLQPPGQVGEAIRQFIAARQLLGRPVAVSRWQNETFLSF